MEGGAFGKRVDVRRREGERREGRKRWGEKGRGEIQRPREIKLEMTSNKREKKRGEEKQKRRGRRGRKRTERKEIKRNGGKGNVCVHMHTCVHTTGGQHAELPHLFKPPRARSKFDIIVGSSHSFQHSNKLFLIICYNLMGPPSYIWFFTDQNVVLWHVAVVPCWGAQLT